MLGRLRSPSQGKIPEQEEKVENPLFRPKPVKKQGRVENPLYRHKHPIRAVVEKDEPNEVQNPVFQFQKSLKRTQSQKKIWNEILKNDSKKGNDVSPLRVPMDPSSSKKKKKKKKRGRKSNQSSTSNSPRALEVSPPTTSNSVESLSPRLLSSDQFCQGLNSPILSLHGMDQEVMKRVSKLIEQKRPSLSDFGTGFASQSLYMGAKQRPSLFAHLERPANEIHLVHRGRSKSLLSIPSWAMYLDWRPQRPKTPPQAPSPSPPKRTGSGRQRHRGSFILQLPKRKPGSRPSDSMDKDVESFGTPRTLHVLEKAKDKKGQLFLSALSNRQADKSESVANSPARPAPDDRKTRSAASSPITKRNILADTQYSNMFRAATGAMILDEGEGDHLLRWELSKNKETRRIIAGTLQKLVEHLATDREMQDREYISAFLLTYRVFSNPKTVFDMLTSRYNVEGSETFSQDEWKLFDRARLFIRLRLVNVLKKWLERHPYDFLEDEETLDQLTDFISMMREHPNSKEAEWAGFLEAELEVATSEPKSPDRTHAPMPLLPKNVLNRAICVEDVRPLEIARQLTLIDFEIFRAIRPTELMRTAWNGKDKEVAAPNVVRLIQRFNDVAYWVATEIILTANLKQRVALVERFIRICQELRLMKNYQGVMQVYSALNNACVQRLKRTWSKVDKKSLHILRDIEEEMDFQHNYKRYRKIIAKDTAPPVLPFQGAYLSDLTFIEENEDYCSRSADGSPSDESPLINWHKFELVGRILAQVNHFQNSPYVFEKILPIRMLLVDELMVLDDKELFPLSRKLEPPGEFSGPDKDSTLSRFFSIRRK